MRAVLHDHGEIVPGLHQRDVLHRVAAHQQQVGEVAFLHLAELARHAHQLRADRRGAAQRVGRRIAEPAHEMLDIARVLAHRRHGEAVVAADHHPHAAPAEFAIGLAGEVEHPEEAERFHGLAVQAVFLALPGGVVDEAESRADKGRVLDAFQRVERFLVGIVAVVDALDAVPDRHHHALRRAGVAGHHLAEIARDPDKRRHFVIVGRRDLAPGERHEIVAGEVDLELVHAVADAFARHLAHLLRPVGDKAEAFLVEVALALVAEPGGGGDLGRAGAHAGTGQHPLLDGVAGIDAQQRLGRSRFEDRGEAVLQQQPQVLRRQQHVPLGADPAEVRRGHDAGEARMAMAFHHAGHQGHAGAVDPLFRQVAHGLACRRHRGDAVALHHDSCGNGSVRLAVPDLRTGYRYSRHCLLPALPAGRPRGGRVARLCLPGGETAMRPRDCEGRARAGYPSGAMPRAPL